MLQIESNDRDEKNKSTSQTQHPRRADGNTGSKLAARNQSVKNKQLNAKNRDISKDGKSQIYNNDVMSQKSFKVNFNLEDSIGVVGASLSKQTSVAAKAKQKNVS